MTLGCFENKESFLTSARTPIRNGEQVRELMDTLLFLREVAIIRAVVYTKIV
jgi:hypothetical protein